MIFERIERELINPEIAMLNQFQPYLDIQDSWEINSKKHLIVQHRFLIFDVKRRSYKAFLSRFYFKKNVFK